MIKLTTKVTVAWGKRAKLYAEGNKLYAEGDKLYAEGNKLKAEGNKLRAEGDITFLSAVIEAYGNVEIKWTDSGCSIGADIELKNDFEPLIMRIAECIEEGQ